MGRPRPGQGAVSRVGAQAWPHTQSTEQVYGPAQLPRTELPGLTLLLLWLVWVLAPVRAGGACSFTCVLSSEGLWGPVLPWA